MATTTNDLMRNNARQVLESTNSALESIDKVANATNSLIGDNRAAISEFSDQGLRQLGPTIIELRETLRSLKQLSDQLSTSNSLLLGRDQPKEFEPEMIRMRALAAAVRRRARSRRLRFADRQERTVHGLRAALHGAGRTRRKAASVPWQLSIDTPVASDALDTSRMLVMPTPGALETYKGGALGRIRRRCCCAHSSIQAFQDSGRIAGVGASTSGLHGDYLLAIDLYDFETQYRDGVAVRGDPAQRKTHRLIVEPHRGRAHVRRGHARRGFAGSRSSFRVRAGIGAHAADHRRLGVDRGSIALGKERAAT